MSFEDDRHLASGVSLFPMGQISVPLVLAVVLANRISVPAVRRGGVESIVWAQSVFGQQLMVQIQISTVSEIKKKDSCYKSLTV